MATTLKFPIVIAGSTCAGKTTLAKALIEELPDASRIISYTTRSPRTRERDGIDYHFISREQFGTMLRNGDFVEHTSRASSNGVVFYGTAKSDFTNHARSVAVMDLVGIRSLKSMGIEFTSILLKISDVVALQRALGRGDSNDETSMRLREDSVLFADADDMFDLILDGSKSIEENVSTILSM